MVATHSYEGVARIWDIGTRMPLSAPTEHEVALGRQPAISPDGRWLVTHGHNGEGAYLWSIPQAPGNAEEMREQTELALGSRLRERGIADPLRAEEWKALKAKLARQTQPMGPDGP